VDRFTAIARAFCLRRAFTTKVDRLCSLKAG
jgi:hypothetical protein